MTKKALITGITGQDGSYLAEFLLSKVMKFMVWCAGRARFATNGFSTYSINSKSYKATWAT